MINRFMRKESIKFPLVLVIMVFVAFGGCSSSHQLSRQKAIGESVLLNQNVMAILWYQRAAETRALYYQAFNVAHDRLSEILKNDTSDVRKAVVVDIDETVLNNSPYQAMNIIDNVTYPIGWKKWTASAEAKATPGSVQFLNYAYRHDVDVYYVTNRNIDEMAGTLHNLRKLGFPQAEKSHLLMKTTTSNKTKRRKEIRKTHKIVLLCGDNLGDFDQLFQHHSSKTRNELVDQYSSKFGEKFIVLPNPMYGEWEGTTYHYKWGMNARQKAKVRKKALNYYHINDK